MLLVRDKGVGTYQDVRRALQGSAIDLGYDALFGDGPVSFREVGPR
jgi:hypothetical protein